MIRLRPTTRCLRGATLLLGLVAKAGAVEDFERPPIEYSASVPQNAVSELRAKLERGDVRLAYQEGLGYLPAVLKELNVSVESQMLVFSKTSLQRRRISPRTPRAVYFNDEVYVGYCRGGEVMEISVADPQFGAVFYTLEQQPAERPKLVRQTESCLVCHSSSRTEGVPGHLVRSVFAGASGEPLLSAGSYTVDYRTPFERRWGGWYVTGSHGKQKHLGNFIARDKNAPSTDDNVDGQNVSSLAERFKVEHYLSPHSDLVALMVLEHQALVHNRLTRANFETRAALHYQADLNRALGQPLDAPLESATRRIQVAGDDLVDALLLVDEAALAESVSGTSSFATMFAALGPHDPHGRSLREFDLNRRMFKYPCSYLIYSAAFDALPQPIKRYVWQRLGEVLQGKDSSGKFAHLAADDRRAIVEILCATKSDRPADWPSIAAP